MSGQPPKIFLTVKEAATHGRVSKMTVYRLVNSGEVRSVKIGKSVRIRCDDWLAYLKSRTSN